MGVSVQQIVRLVLIWTGFLNLIVLLMIFLLSVCFFVRCHSKALFTIRWLPISSKMLPMEKGMIIYENELRQYVRSPLYICMHVQEIFTLLRGQCYRNKSNFILVKISSKYLTVLIFGLYYLFYYFFLP